MFQDYVFLLNTYQKVKDGHIHDVEQPVARSIEMCFFYCVTVERIHFPPIKKTQNSCRFVEKIIVEKFLKTQTVNNIFILRITEITFQFDLATKTGMANSSGLTPVVQ